jgi:hypothetical protein
MKNLLRALVVMRPSNVFLLAFVLFPMNAARADNNVPRTM